MVATIRVRGAREHNLKGIDLAIPREKITVITGVSGSGKSTLAFDILHAEGQRRYVESLSPYARSFLEQLQKPDVDSVEGLPPTISIDTGGVPGNLRSTVATLTEIYDYLRLLYARAGAPHCHRCGKPIGRLTVDQIVDRLVGLPEGTKLILLAPLVMGKRGGHKEILKRVRREGFPRVRLDGRVQEIGEIPALDRRRNHRIEVVIDRLTVKEGARSRIHDSTELALRLGEGWVTALKLGTGAEEEMRFSQRHACVSCGLSVPDLSPRAFSFNSPHGACPECGGLGATLRVDPDLVAPVPNRSLRDGAIEVWTPPGRRVTPRHLQLLAEFSRLTGARLDVPFKKLKAEDQRAILHGREGFVGVIPDLERRFAETRSHSVKERLLSSMREMPCSACDGERLRPEVRAVRVGGKSISGVTRLSVGEAVRFFAPLSSGSELGIAGQEILKEIRLRLGFLSDVGLHYITLDRLSSTLSGGEARRIRLATQAGAGLVGVAYILDEPTVGLHPVDTRLLLRGLRKLQQAGNTVILVEHDDQTIRASDFMIDLGPGAGEEGGRIVAEGPTEEVIRKGDSSTAEYLRGVRRIEIPDERRKPRGQLEVLGAREHNLKGIDVAFPLRTLTCVTGVSGSGKTTLVRHVLYRALARKLNKTNDRPGQHREIRGAHRLDQVLQIDQAPIGRTPRSNPATYTEIWGRIRGVFALTREAKIRGYEPSRFSFNCKGGRCEACRGQGVQKIEMHFLPDIFVRCDVCKGHRFNRETLEVQYRGLSVADVLDLTVERAIQVFKAFPKIKRVLDTLDEVGLGYLRLGQPSTTLSGGEAQRLKMAGILARPRSGRSLIVLDEPTTGLHFEDISRLLEVLSEIVNRGNTVVVVEHNLDVIKCADHVIDLGPGGGAEGGSVVAAGTPEAVAATAGSRTGECLKRILVSSAGVESAGSVR
ncbi:MAG: excinuclease ABC subunit UvrA [Planctomycetota bacterium]|nr:excinuclease ABC subunit UvrA [Planctomycetota bacterium]